VRCCGLFGSELAAGGRVFGENVYPSRSGIFELLVKKNNRRLVSGPAFSWLWATGSTGRSASLQSSEARLPRELGAAALSGAVPCTGERNRFGRGDRQESCLSSQAKGQLHSTEIFSAQGFNECMPRMQYPKSTHCIFVSSSNHVLAERQALPVSD